MKLYITCAGVCLIILMSLGACNSVRAPTNQIRDVTDQSNNQITYEEIRSTVERIVGTQRPVSADKLKELEVYLDTLKGKHVAWEGWTVSINPDKQTLAEIEKTEKYAGDFRVWVDMQDPQRDGSDYLDGIVILRETTRTQAEQFAKWHDPGPLPVPQKVMFQGSIRSVLADQFVIFVSAFEVSLKN